MLALIAALGLLASALLDPSPWRSAPDPQPGCPPCTDQLPQGARLLGTAAAGPDASGTVETLVVYFVRDPSFPSAELGQVGALAIRASNGGVQTYRLGDDLGELPFATLSARDVNGDGVTELAVGGGVGAHSFLLHIYRWNGAGYDLIGNFFGDSGVGLQDLDGDGIDEVVVGLRHYDRAQTRHDDVLVWAGRDWQPAYSRWSFTFDDELFMDYPEAAVLRYYLAVAARDYRTAYNLLGPTMQSGQSFESFVAGFAGTRDVRVEDLEVTNDGTAKATVRVEISTIEADGANKRFGGTWIAERTNNAWRLAGAYITPV